MLNSQPCWYLILDHFVKNSYVHNGLTLPFLIGAGIYIDSASERLTIEKILTEFKFSSKPVSVMRCGNIGEYVFALLDNESTPYRSVYKEFGNLVITDGSFDGALAFSDLVSSFESMYSEQLNNQLYSKEGGRWQAFSQVDISRLKEITDCFN